MAKIRISPRTVRLGSEGRLLIPKPFREALGIRPGDLLVLWPQEDGLLLRPWSAVEAELFSLLEGVEGSLAEELIAERREEARREERS